MTPTLILLALFVNLLAFAAAGAAIAFLYLRNRHWREQADKHILARDTAEEQAYYAKSTLANFSKAPIRAALSDDQIVSMGRIFHSLALDAMHGRSH